MLLFDRPRDGVLCVRPPTEGEDMSRSRAAQKAACVVLSMLRQCSRAYLIVRSSAVYRLSLGLLVQHNLDAAFCGFLL